MPGYPWLAQTEVRYLDDRRPSATSSRWSACRIRDQIANADADLRAQATRTTPASRRCRTLSQGDRAQFRWQGRRPTEIDALIAYLQMLGTLVDFKLYDEKANFR